MKLNLRVTPATIELIKRYEGLRERAARRSDGIWVIGYGHTRYAREGAQVSEKDAEALLVYDLMQISSALEKVIETPLNAHQFDALAAFTFDIGIEDFRNSDVLRWVRDGALLQAASAIEAWRPPQDGRDRPSLDEIIRRRAEEKALFLRPVSNAGPAPLVAPRPVAAARPPEPAPPVAVIAPTASVPAPGPAPIPTPVVTVAPPPAAPVVAPVAAVFVQPVVSPPAPTIAEPPTAAMTTLETLETSQLPQPLRPVPPTVEPAVRRAAPPAPTQWAALVDSDLLRPNAETPTLPAVEPIIDQSASRKVEVDVPEPPAASVDVSHYDALLQALEATGPEVTTSVEPPVMPESAAPEVVQAPPEPKVVAPVAPVSFDVAPVAPRPVEPVTIAPVPRESVQVASVTVAPELVAPEPVAPEPVAQEPVATETAEIEPAAAALHREPVVQVAPVHVEAAPATPIPAAAVFVLGEPPANDHPMVPLELAPVGVEPEEATKAELAVSPSEAAPEVVVEGREDASAPVVAPRPPSPPPLKRWTPPPRPPRPDRAISTAAHLEPTSIALAPAPAPAPEPVFVQPEPPVAPAAAMVAEEAKSSSAPQAAPEAPAETPAVAHAASELPQAPVEQLDPVLPPEAVSAVTDVAALEVVASTAPKPPRRPLFQRAPEVEPAPPPPPPKPREPVKLRLGALPYLLLGLLGVMLFTGALVSMFRQANVANLLAGLAGVAFMAPSAGHFLLTLVSGQKTPPSQPV